MAFWIQIRKPKISFMWRDIVVHWDLTLSSGRDRSFPRALIAQTSISIKIFIRSKLLLFKCDRNFETMDLKLEPWMRIEIGNLGQGLCSTRQSPPPHDMFSGDVSWHTNKSWHWQERLWFVLELLVNLSNDDNTSTLSISLRCSDPSQSLLCLRS